MSGLQVQKPSDFQTHEIAISDTLYRYSDTTVLFSRGSDKHIGYMNDQIARI
jgi:hypothetical protein